MKKMFNTKFKLRTLIVSGLLMFILGLTCVSYAGTYNSSEISYDTSTSGAVQSNVKAALDFLYNKTKSGASAECPDNMSCVLKPGVTMNVSGPGSVDKGTVYVGLNESSTFKVTPNSGYTLKSISCNNGYTLGSFKVLSNEAMSAQTITITNPGTTTGASCSIEFSTNEITIQSSGWSAVGTSGGYDTCNSAGTNCVCWYIKNGGSNFSYNGHTGCNFKSTTCKYSTYSGGSSFNCANLNWYSYINYWVGSGYGAACSGVITCAT